MEYYSLSVDPWTCKKTAHTALIPSLLEFVTILQTVWGDNITTSVFWW
jgi:hypothetical protein